MEIGKIYLSIYLSEPVRVSDIIVSKLSLSLYIYICMYVHVSVSIFIVLSVGSRKRRLHLF